MSKKRTKNQKIKAQSRRSASLAQIDKTQKNILQKKLEINLSDTDRLKEDKSASTKFAEALSSQTIFKNKVAKPDSLILKEQKYTFPKQELLKSVIVSIIISFVLFGFYIYLR